MIADDAISESKIASGAVSSDKIADGAAIDEILDDDGAGSNLDSDLLDGLDSGAFASNIHNHDSRYVNRDGDTMSGSSTSGLLTITNADGSGSALYGENTTNGNYGLIGGQEPNSTSYNVGVYGEGRPGVYGKHMISDNWGFLGGSNFGVGGWGIGDGTTGVYGSSNGSTSAAGVRGDASMSGGVGVYGVNLASNAQGRLGCYAIGVQGQASYLGVVGVQGVNSGHGTGFENIGTLGHEYYGVVGDAFSTNGLGVFGIHHQSGNFGYIGHELFSVYGEHGASGNGGFIGHELYGIRGDGFSGNVGVFGIHQPSLNWGALGTNNYAGEFAGNVTVYGNLEKSSGAFKIDHPLDPENKYLYHSFVESPDMMNVYNGNAILDADGEAWVKLPEWFEALNKDFRYQLTPVGTPGPNLYIAEEISENRFRIAGGSPGMKVSWQVTGIRQDPWAKANRIVVEEDKPEQEQGSYIHPELYGKTEEQSVGWAQNPKIMQQMKEEKEISLESKEPLEG